MALAAVVALAGCYFPPGWDDPKPRQDEAVALVLGIYGSGGAHPDIEWAEGGNLDCTVTSNGKRGFTTPRGCLEGWTWLPWETSVAYREGDRFSDTALAHELQHVAQLRRFRLDPEHRGCEWEWNPTGQVNRANLALIERGM